MVRLALCVVVFYFTVGFVCRTSSAADAPGMNAPAVLASIRLRNPTAWKGPVPIEVPVGHLATPGKIDWARVRLLAEDGSEVPFAIREGRPHWKSRLTAPIVTPRAEDLLVFSYSPGGDAWSHIDVVPGAHLEQSAASEQADRMVVAYPNLQVSLHPTTGMITQITAYGQPLLDKPFAVTFKASSGEGSMRKISNAPQVRLTGKSSTASMTELHFVLQADEKLAIGLTYRIHAAGMIEVLADERPWHGVSPWLNHSAIFRLPLAGKAKPLRYLLNRAPFYGFPQYASVVKHVASFHRGPQAAILELGEETTNGRRWNRRLFIIPANRATQAEALAELADEGPIVAVSPMRASLPAGEIRIAASDGARAAAKVLVEAFKRTEGVATASLAEDRAAGATIFLRQVEPSDAAGIEGDGFEVRTRPNAAGVEVVALTRFGLYQAALRIAESLDACEKLSVPLIASNPAVGLRGGGFGGGGFEVDFPFGSEVEWQAALEQLIAGGMNVMCDLGMWSNWKMPVSYREMPELRSDSPDAYDEVSGVKFAEYETHHQRGLRLLSFLHDRGVRVWVWLPVGCVPTTYVEKYPEAMSPENPKFPCFTHPQYNRYLQGLLKELLATYSIDGIVMIRDDNGGMCSCERCKAFVDASLTRNAAWEQYLIVYRWLRASGFRGDIAVYPYTDPYESRMEPRLPDDLLIVGHGSGVGMLTRNYETLAPMGDTWLDTVFSGFRVPTSARMKRLLADRNSFWLGGALCGNELTWQAIGRFGWEPTATVNTLRYERGRQQFGIAHARQFVRLTQVYELLESINNLDLLPHNWVAMPADQRRDLGVRARQNLQRFRERLKDLEESAANGRHATWFGHLKLFAAYVEYHLKRLEIFSQMCELVAANRQAGEGGEGLPTAVREQLLAMHGEVYRLAKDYDQESAAAPGKMLASIRSHQFTLPFKEWRAGYDASLDRKLEIKQFNGTITVLPEEIEAGKPFVLRVRLRNTGVCPWLPGVGHRLEITGDNAKRLRLSPSWEYNGPPMVFGDSREIEFQGVAPKEAGEIWIQISFYSPFRTRHAIVQQEFKLRCK